MRIERDDVALVEGGAREDDEPPELARTRLRTSPAAAACCGARIIDSCGRRRSRAAERTIRQMKR